VKLNKFKLAKKNSSLERKETYLIIEVLGFVRMAGQEHPEKRNYDGDLVKMGSLRYQTFIKSGTQCVTCGLEASFFAKEKNNGEVSYHFNLYGIDSSGDEVLFTKDHIHPKSKGGKDLLSNFQTMCIICNSIKGNTLS
jgi:hypothetical protein